ncbi:hypothetical protein HYU20_01560 [Candidatus Woesearchaeota archaeon]|nr:hypothetical protein [Candidatus Woesearchaeota archaeon]
MVGESVEYWRNLPISDPAAVRGAKKGHYCIQVSGIEVVEPMSVNYGIGYILLSLVQPNGEKLRCSLSLRVDTLPPNNERGIAGVFNQKSSKGLEGIVGIKVYPNRGTVSRGVGYFALPNQFEAVIENRKVVFYSAAPA